MKSTLSLAPRSHWLWWPCGAAFIIGMALGWQKIQSGNEPLPATTNIRQFARDDFELDHPLSRLSSYEYLISNCLGI